MINELLEFLGNNWVLITQIISTVLLGFVFIMFREFEDESARNTWKKPFKFLWWKFSVHWLNTGTGWKDKWALDENGELIPYTKRWYHFGVTPDYKERFPYSSTILVSLTDGEHTFQKMQLDAIFGMFFIWNWIAGISAFIGIYTFTFIKEKFLGSIS